ncbi:MAG TPA: NAD-dependent epimerase/dehydratase family protein [Gammaproteobacteria bacterium]
MKFDLVFGAGPLGRAVADELAGRGRAVKFATRSCGGDLPHECLRIDLLAPNLQERPADVERIFVCSAPVYWRWPQELVPMVEGALQLARATGASLVFADNLYAYGPSAEPLTENTPCRPQGPKGRARLEAAERILRAHESGQVRAAIVRSSDFYGPGVHVSSLGSDAFQRVAGGKAVNCLGDIDQPHSFNFIEDFAGALINVAGNEDCHGQVWHAPAAAPLSMRETVKLIADQCGREAKFNIAPRWLFRLLSLFNRYMKELDEVYYLYTRPLMVDSGKYERRFGITATPHIQGIQKTLASLGIHPV